MRRPSLSDLCMESANLSKVPLKWLLCAACVHAGLFCLPKGNYKPTNYGIVFRDGNAGVEVDLIVESAESSVDQATASPDSSADPMPLSPDLDSIVAETEYVAPDKAAVTVSLHSPKKANRTNDRALPRAGTRTAQPAAQVYTTQPPYPPRAREVGAEGVVRLRVRIGADGSPREVKVVHPSGRSDFDLSSINTVQREWRFRPARNEDGSAVESTIVVAIRFTLKS